MAVFYVLIEHGELPVTVWQITTAQNVAGGGYAELSGALLDAPTFHESVLRACCMAELKKTYLLVLAPNCLIVPVPEGEEGGGSVELSDAEIAEVFGDMKGNWHLVVAPSKEVPTLATLVRVTSRAGYTAHTRGECLVTVNKHMRRGETLWAEVTPVERPSAKPKPKEIERLKADFTRYIQSNPKDLKIFRRENVLNKIKAMHLAEELAFWLLARTPLPHEERMRLAPLSAADQAKGLVPGLIPRIVEPIFNRFGL